MTARDRVSQEAKSLAEDLHPWPGTVEEVWEIIDAKLEEVRADEHDTGYDCGYEDGYAAAEFDAAEEGE